MLNYKTFNIPYSESSKEWQAPAEKLAGQIFAHQTIGPPPQKKKNLEKHRVLLNMQSNDLEICIVLYIHHWRVTHLWFLKSKYKIKSITDEKHQLHVSVKGGLSDTEHLN